MTLTSLKRENYFADIVKSYDMFNRELISSEWSEKVVPIHAVPPTLHPHQLDAMALLKEKKHVLLGSRLLILCFFNKVDLLGVPTGSGKTLPQLATILTMPGFNCKIYP